MTRYQMVLRLQRAGVPTAHLALADDDVAEELYLEHFPRTAEEARIAEATRAAREDVAAAETAAKVAELLALQRVLRELGLDA